MTSPAPHCAQLALLVKAPNIPDTIRNLISKDLPGGPTHVFVPCREYDFVGFQFATISEQQSMRLDLCDLLPLLDFDLAVYDKLTSPNINVVSTTSLKVSEVDQLPSFDNSLQVPTS